VGSTPTRFRQFIFNDLAVPMSQSQILDGNSFMLR